MYAIDRPPCSCTMGWYAERPCRSFKPTSLMFLCCATCPVFWDCASAPPPAALRPNAKAAHDNKPVCQLLLVKQTMLFMCLLLWKGIAGCGFVGPLGTPDGRRRDARAEPPNAPAGLRWLPRRCYHHAGIATTANGSSLAELLLQRLDQLRPVELRVVDEEPHL